MAKIVIVDDDPQVISYESEFFDSLEELNEIFIYKTRPANSREILERIVDAHTVVITKATTQIKYTDSDGQETSYPLSLFFQQAIDAIAMHDGSITSGEYLDAWEWGKILDTDKEPEDIVLSFDNNIPKSFINKLRKLHDSGQRDPSPGAIDIWFQN